MFLSAFENALKRFTLISVALIIATAACAGSCTAVKRTAYNISGQKPVAANEKLPEIVSDFKRIVNF